MGTSAQALIVFLCVAVIVLVPPQYDLAILWREYREAGKKPDVFDKRWQKATFYVWLQGWAIGIILGVTFYTP